MIGKSETISSRSRIAGVPGLDRARDLALQVPLSLWVLVSIALVLRLTLIVSYRPAFLAFNDTAGFVAMAGDGGLFSDPLRPIGYSLFLKFAHAISADVDFTILLQHLLGIATGLLLYGVVRRLGAPLWVALVAAAAVLLPIDQIALEHSLLSEALFTFVLVSFLYAAVRALEAGREPGPAESVGRSPLAGPVSSYRLWLLAAGVLLGLAPWVRSVALPLIPLVGIWAILALGAGWRERIVNAGLVVLPAVAIVVAYAAWSEARTGEFAIGRTGGWILYGRVAPFADCSKFEPPAGTRGLCETTPEAERPGQRFYGFDPNSPAVRLFGLPPAGNDKLGEFGWAAAKAQPLEYASAIAGDFVRYFFPDGPESRPYGSVGYEEIELQRRAPDAEETIRVNALNSYYEFQAPVTVHRPAQWLADLQPYLRVQPLLMFQALVLAALGLWYSSGRVRWGILLLGGVAVVMLAVSAAGIYNPRYAMPGNGPLIAAGALGLWALVQRVRPTIAGSKH